MPFFHWRFVAFSLIFLFSAATPSSGQVPEEIKKFVQAGHHDAEEMLDDYLKGKSPTLQDLKESMSYYYVLEAYEKVEEIADQVLTKEDLVLAYRLKGFAQVLRRRYQQGQQTLETYFDKVSEANILPTDYEMLAKAKLPQKDYEGALREIEKGLSKFPGNKEMMWQKVDIFYKIKRYAEAAPAAKAYVEQHRGKFKNYFSWVQSAFMLASETGKTDDFLAAAQTFDEKYGKSHVPKLMLGRAHALKEKSSGEAGLAKPFYAQVLDMLEADDKQGKHKRDYFEACRYMGAYYLMKQGDCEQGLAYFDKIMEIRPDDPGAKAAKEYCANKN